jgi:hypothetical protein
MRHIITLIALGILGACSKAPEQKTIKVDENLTTTDISQTSAASIPAPNYDDREGDKYFYVAAVSEEDQKKGKATGDVSIFRYLGIKDGTYRLEIISDGGQRLAIAECKRPCKVTKTVWNDGRVTRGGYNPDSILGSAFADAFNGHLAVAGSEKEISAPLEPLRNNPNSIPPAFVGEWNESLADCGTDNNDTRLRVEPTRLLFYESVAQVKDVSLQGARTATIKGSFSGEGETWNDTYRMTLSQSGNELTTGGLTRKRCR